MNKSLLIKPNSVFYYLLKILAVLIVLNFIAIFVEYYMNLTGNTSYMLQNYVVTMFDFNQERNIPTFFSTINLVISAGILFYISRVAKRHGNAVYHKHWFYLSCIFVYLALDELLSIHEFFQGAHFQSFFKNVLQREDLGIFYFTWVVPYFAVVVLVGLYYFKFVFSLPRIITINIVIAGALFVAGAIGVEMVQAYLVDSAGSYEIYSSVHLKLWTTLEETMEMFAIIFFIKTLIDYLAIRGDASRLAINLKFVNKNQTLKAETSEVSVLSIKDYEAVEVTKY